MKQKYLAVYTQYSTSLEDAFLRGYLECLEGNGVLEDVVWSTKDTPLDIFNFSSEDFFGDKKLYNQIKKYAESGRERLRAKLPPAKDVTISVNRARIIDLKELKKSIPKLKEFEGFFETLIYSADPETFKIT